MTAVLLLLLAPMVLVPWRQNHAVPWVMGLAGRPAPVAEQVTAARQEAQRAGDVDALGELAMICHANGLYDSAQQCYQQLERRAPQDYRWVYLQVLLAEARAEVEPPVQLLRRTVALNKGYAPAWYRLGQTWFKQGKDQEAARAFERAQSGESGSYAALGLARIRLKQDRPESALRTLQSAVRRRPQFGPVHRMLGQVYGRLGRDEDAQWHNVLAGMMRPHGSPPEPLLDELATFSRSREFLLERAVMDGRTARLDGKRKWLARALQFYPDDVVLRRELDDLDRVLQTAKQHDTSDRVRFDAGLEVFSSVCAMCHGPEGKGQLGKAPPLVGSQWLGSPPSRVVRIVLDGLRGGEEQFDRGMPSLRALDDEQLATVLNYARGRFAEVREPIAAGTIEQIRAATQGRRGPWVRKELDRIAP